MARYVTHTSVPLLLVEAADKKIQILWPGGLITDIPMGFIRENVTNVRTGKMYHQSIRTPHWSISLRNGERPVQVCVARATGAAGLYLALVLTGYRSLLRKDIEIENGLLDELCSQIVTNDDLAKFIQEQLLKPAIGS